MQPLKLLIPVAVVALAGCAAIEPAVRPLDTLHTLMLLDRSGSMSAIRDDVVGGFNQYLADLRQQPDSHRVTLAQFDAQNPFELIHDAANASSIPQLSPAAFQPRGATPLYDAMMAMMQHGSESAVADRVVMVVVSDGAENASRRHDRKSVFEEVARREKEHGWSFVFLGANQDAYSEGGALGMRDGNTQNFEFSGRGVRTALKSLSRGSLQAVEAAIQPEELQKNFFGGVKEAEAELQRQAREP